MHCIVQSCTLLTCWYKSLFCYGAVAHGLDVHAEELCPFIAILPTPRTLAVAVPVAAAAAAAVVVVVVV
eukprot:4546312-Amphidinium_carterae.1